MKQTLSSDFNQRSSELVCKIMAGLPKRLNQVRSPSELANVIFEAIRSLLPIDSFYFDLYSPELDTMSKVMLVDVVDGIQTEVAQPSRNLEPSAIFREVCASGSKLILRRGESDTSGTVFRPFGDKQRPSASLIFVPIRTNEHVYGILSIQSYSREAYAQQDLHLVESLADQCCGVLIRLELDKNYHSIFENAVEGVLRASLAGTLLSANRALAHMLGYGDSSELTQTTLDIRQKLFADSGSYCEFEKALCQQRTLEQFETRFLDQGGNVRWVLLNAHLELDSNRDALYYEATVRDVTAEKCAECSLAQTEALYRHAISAAGAVSYATHYATRSYSFIDPAIETLIGYKPSEMSPALWTTIVLDRVMRGEVAGLSASEAGVRVRSGELKHWHCDMLIKHRNGQKRWISDSSVQRLGMDGRPEGSVGILQDITERKTSELTAIAFAKLSQGLSSASTAESAAEIISQISKELFGWDAFWVKLYKPGEDALYRILCVDTIDGELVRDEERIRQRAAGMNLRVLNNGSELILRDNPKQEHGTIPFGDKGRPSASIMAVAIHYRGRPVGIISAQSYTVQAYDQQALQTFKMLADQCGGAFERIWADEALRKSEWQFRVVWDSSVDAMRLTDAQGTVLMVNDAYCRLVEKDQAELEGRSMSIIHSESNQDRVIQAHQQRFAGNVSDYRLEKEVLLWNGKRLWLELSNSMLDLPDSPPLLLTIMRDISERKQAEGELAILNEQLIAASRNAGMAEVASGVLHNVGNVLNSVNVSAHVVSERLRNSRQSNIAKIAQMLEEQASNLGSFFVSDPRGQQLPSYLRKLADYLAEDQALTLRELEILRKNIDHIKDIVSMQQNYARVSGVIEAHLVQDLVNDALQMNAAALARHDVSLVRNFEAAPTVVTDKHKVLQILVNFIRNAKYACDEGGSADKGIVVTIRMRGNEHVQIIVEDNGVGIPSENLTRIFSHGFTTRENGHGFGLHSSALAAKELGGAILVHSDGLGKGATFTLELPTRFEGK